jgi:hypothetical protein
MRKILVLALILSLSTLFAQEAILSTEENYYDFLALDGYVERPYLNYRTLSDSKWAIKDESGNIWAANNLGTTKLLTENIAYRVYGPNLFTSYNSAAPYGQNDGALWQGKGFNTSVTAGARLEAYGFEVTLKPQVCFSQNLAFDLVSPNSAYSSYTGKGAEYGYYGVAYVDAPQRFGNDPFFTFSWGDSEIRYTWKNLTAGFGTQSVWLGPAKINAILLSNNAAPFPKADIGLRKTSITLPKLGWYLGDIEARVFCGYLSESDYFDNDSSNNHNMLSGLSVAYAPPIFSGLTFFANRTYLAKWDDSDSWKTLPSLFFVDLNALGGSDVWDQRASFGAEYLIPKGGIDIYGELGVNDYGISIDGYIRYPFHSMVYTAGARKSVPLPFKNLRGELTFEWTNLELSQDFQFQWPATFYCHGQITQGYTNDGQWLGAGNGTGGNSQYLGFKIYHGKGNVNLYVHRQNIDNDYIYCRSINSAITAGVISSESDMVSMKAVLSFGITTDYYIFSNLRIYGGLVYSVEYNPCYNPISWNNATKRYNYRAEFALSYQL